MKVSWIKITNSGTRAWLVQEYLSVFAKGWREDAGRIKRHAWHNADGRCSGLACDRSNVTVVHLSVVGGLQIQTRLSSFAEREEQVARRTSQERVNPFWHWNDYMISIPSSSKTTSALQRMPMMIVQMLQHAPYWFRVLGWRGKSMLCSIACSEAFVETRPGGPFVPMSMSVTLHVDNEGKHASWSGGSSAWDRLPKQVSGKSMKTLVIHRWVLCLFTWQLR